LDFYLSGEDDGSIGDAERNVWVRAFIVGRRGRGSSVG